MKWKVVPWLVLLLLALITSGARSASATRLQVTLENPSVVADQTITADLGTPLTITDASGVEQLYEAIKALPQIPTYPPGTVLFCLHNTAEVYHLTFWYQNLIVLDARMHPTGCPSVTLGNDDPRILEPDFWSFLGQVTGIDTRNIHPSSLP